MNNNQKVPLTLFEISEAAKKRVTLIDKEFTDGFEFVKNYPKSVTFFGSARFEENDAYYQKARQLAARIVTELHYAVVTGGGPGIMEAANKGAYEAGGNSIGFTIELPHEQITNKYLTDQIGFHYFFSRKVCLAFSAEAYIFFPGGFGTLDEFTEILTLIQTGKIPKAPIILFGQDSWLPLETFFKDVLIKNQTIDPEDTSLYVITDDEDQILEIIKNAPIRIGLQYSQKSEEATNQNGKDKGEGPLSSLSQKHCVPCEGDTIPLSSDDSKELLKHVNQWTLIEDKEIEKTYDFKNFNEAINFMNIVAQIAKKEDHHPDINLHDFKKVDIKISTHSIDGLSENDFILAAKIDEALRNI